LTFGQDSRASSTAGLSGLGAPRRNAPSAVTTKLAVRVEDPTRESFGRESGEDNRVHGAEAHDREHGDHGLGDHGHVHRDAVTFFHTKFRQGVRRLGDQL